MGQDRTGKDRIGVRMRWNGTGRNRIGVRTGRDRMGRDRIGVRTGRDGTMDCSQGYYTINNHDHGFKLIFSFMLFAKQLFHKTGEFRFHKKLSNGLTRWRCEKYNCNAYVKTNGPENVVIFENLNHTHAVDNDDQSRSIVNITRQ